MSVTCSQFIGYTYTTKTNLKSDDFDVFKKFLKEHPEYELRNKTTPVSLVVDGMNGEYARLIYVDLYIPDIYDNDTEPDYFSLNSKTTLDEKILAVFEACSLLEEEVSREMIDYAVWYHYS